MHIPFFLEIVITYCDCTSWPTIISPNMKCYRLRVWACFCLQVWNSWFKGFRKGRGRGAADCAAAVSVTLDSAAFGANFYTVSSFCGFHGISWILLETGSLSAVPCKAALLLSHLLNFTDCSVNFLVWDFGIWEKLSILFCFTTPLNKPIDVHWNEDNVWIWVWFDITGTL